MLAKYYVLFMFHDANGKRTQSCSVQCKQFPAAASFACIEGPCNVALMRPSRSAVQLTPSGPLLSDLMHCSAVICTPCLVVIVQTEGNSLLVRHVIALGKSRTTLSQPVFDLICRLPGLSGKRCSQNVFSSPFYLLELGSMKCPVTLVNAATDNLTCP